MDPQPLLTSLLISHIFMVINIRSGVSNGQFIRGGDKTSHKHVGPPDINMNSHLLTPPEGIDVRRRKVTCGQFVST